MFRDKALLWEVFINLFTAQDSNQFNSLILKNETYPIFTHSDPISIFKTG